MADRFSDAPPHRTKVALEGASASFRRMTKREIPELSLGAARDEHVAAEPNRCSVLRCAGYPAGTVTLANPIAMTGKRSPIKAIVCADHKAKIDAGLPWKYEPDVVEPSRGSILMGDDFDQAGIMITAVIGIGSHPYDTHPDGSPTVTLAVEQLNGDGSREQLQLFLSEELIKELQRP